MLTRRDLRDATGLTRKALRVYEERGLILSPSEIKDGGPAVFGGEALDQAHKIAVFRAAGLSLDTIERILSFAPGADRTPIAAVQSELQAMKSATDTALDLIDALTVAQEGAVAETNYGGYWAYGAEEVMPVATVCGWVRRRVEDFAEAYGTGHPVAARYVEDGEGNVAVRVFQKRAGADCPPVHGHRSYFIAQQTFGGLSVRGSHGSYDGFEEAYARIDKWRAARGSKDPGWAIEVYGTYHHTCADEDAFETLILH